MERLVFAVVTVSDTRNEQSDLAGPAIVEELERLNPVKIETHIVSDDFTDIQALLKELARFCSVVITTGGTGFTPRDVTPEATLPLLSKRANGIEGLILKKGLEETPFAPLSRGVCGLSGTCFIANLPGSPKGAKCGAKALLPLLPHILDQIAGGTHEPDVD
ncbi:MAG: MogA/MoaB family molybdenum cofactor biosynthesis protein [Fimbriimonadales bacterium]